MSGLFSATEAARRVARGDVGSKELTERVLERIEAANPDVNAIVEVRPGARADAAAADEAVARGETLGPLHGVPITVKEAIHVAGLRSTWGDPAARDFVAPADATVVRRLREAGAIIVGTSNVAFMLADFGRTANELYGATANPRDPGLTPGGSSGGAAAALAAEMTFLDYGSDLTGSIRIPAAFCGVYGLKPTSGIVPLTGFAPPGPPPPPSEMTYLSALGPLARSAADLRTALKVTAGPEGAAAKALGWSLPPSRHARLNEFRVGFTLDGPVSDEIADRLAATVEALGRAGATLVEGWPDGVDPGADAESFGFHVGLFFAFMEPGSQYATLAQVIEHESRRQAARAAWGRYFEDVDVFLCPATTTLPFPIDEEPDPSLPFWASHASYAGLPAVTAPLTGDGPPIGAQIIGPRYEDDTAISFAELLPT
ncbi:hypothetical protein J4573_33585 [Actinomadura barringtoniae]|uniref:Amidase domain-containing protein n=1 Tax=Actinomadura barringtoniae TaxID=1427535 RepID=A0A939T429_9ACTN|nr:amidase family protein [Actinomadura barringtoniae]MBO2452061.1 hypothetical protein [Actinomadura barringtoniae]